MARKNYRRPRAWAHLDTTTNHEEHPKGWTPNRRDPVWCPPFRVFLRQQATVAVSRCARSVRLELGQRRDRNGAVTEISVSDTGIGIRPEDQAKLFEAFVQLNAGARKRAEGTGLGLHLSQKLAALLGGRITLRSEPGKGSTFTVLMSSNSNKDLGCMRARRQLGVL